MARLRAAGCVFAEDEARLLLAEAATPDRLEALVRRRLDGIPLEHVLGWVEFCGLRVAVDPGVFVPRRRSELLVAQAHEVLGHREPRPGRPVVVDLCCGCGAIGLAVAVGQPGVELHASDIDPRAVACATRNLAPLPGARVYRGDLFTALPPGLRDRVDVLLANAPYVPTGEVERMPREAREHEPRVALDGGSGGLDVLACVVAAAGQWLAPGGCLVAEASAGLAEQVGALATRAGLASRVVGDEDLDATAVLASRGT